MSTKSSILITLETLIPEIEKLLTSKIVDGKFVERSFYGESHLAAALQLLGKKESLQKEIHTTYFLHSIANDDHPEFNAYAWQIYGLNKKQISKISFKTIFFRKVSNWVLLRSLVRIRSGNIFSKYIGILQTYLILFLNRSQGYITDNTLRMWHTRKSAQSSQYHAFATLLVGEIALELNNKFLQSQFLQLLQVLVDDKKDGNPIWLGRGKYQLFGYSNYIYALTLAYYLTNNSKYLTAIQQTLNYILKYQEKNGSVPLLLTKNKDPQLLYSYNNFFDYESFFLLSLVRAHKIIKNN